MPPAPTPLLQFLRALTKEQRDAVDSLVRQGFPQEALRWLRGDATEFADLAGIYNDLSDIRRADLIECARVIALAP